MNDRIVGLAKLFKNNTIKCYNIYYNNYELFTIVFKIKDVMVEDRHIFQVNK